MSELTPNPVDAGVQPAVTWDPFQLMDRLDEEALQRELDGVPATDLVYVVKEGGQEVVGLSKTGVDECCMALVGQGQVIREEDLQHEVLGEGLLPRQRAVVDVALSYYTWRTLVRDGGLSRDDAIAVMVQAAMAQS